VNHLYKTEILFGRTIVFHYFVFDFLRVRFLSRVQNDGGVLPNDEVVLLNDGYNSKSFYIY